MSTPRLPTYIRGLQEKRELRMQTAFPAKVVSWKSSTNTVELTPQFIETWVSGDGTRSSEPQTYPNISNVPVLFPRSGSWSITFPIEAGSYGLVTCTKYSLDLWRQKGRAIDPGDLRRFTMSGAVFHPVNLHPDSSTLKNLSSTAMVIGDSDLSSQFVALANKVDTALGLIKTHGHEGSSVSGGAVTVEASTELSTMDTSTGSATVKVSV